MKYLSTTIRLTVLALLLSACQGPLGTRTKSRLNPQDDLTRTHFIHGNVEALVAGSSFNLRSPFAVDQLPDFSGFAMAGLHIFQERIPNSEVKEAKDLRDLEDQNSTDRETEPSKPNPTTNYQFEQLSHDEFVYRSKTGYDMRFHFRRGADDRLVLFALSWPGSGLLHLEKVRHYSEKDDGSAFSVLFQYQSRTYGTTLGAVYFTRLSDRPSDAIYFRTDQSFAFLLGSDIAVGWEKELTFEVCGANALEYSDLIHRAVNAWNVTGKPGQIGYLRYQIVENTNPPPFSDVNSTCIYFSDQYRFEKARNSVVLGLAMPIYNFSTARIVAASTFISLNTHSRGRMDRLEATTIHEIGHVLGLGHEFKRDSFGELLFESIMGYAGITQVTRRDREAIRALYPDVDPKDEDEYTNVTNLVDFRSEEDFELNSLVVWHNNTQIQHFVAELLSRHPEQVCSPEIQLKLLTKSGGQIVPRHHQMIAPAKRDQDGNFHSDCVDQNEVFVVKGQWKANRYRIADVDLVKFDINPVMALIQTRMSQFLPLLYQLTGFDLIRTVKGEGRRIDMKVNNPGSEVVVVSDRSQLLFYDHNLLIHSLDLDRSFIADENSPLIRETHTDPAAIIANRVEPLFVLKSPAASL